MPKILDGEAEARVIALYEGRQGYANWSLRLLAGKVVELGDKPRNGEADAKKRLFLQKESPVPGTRKRSSWRNKCLKSNLTTRSVRWSAWTSSRCSKETRVPATADPTRRLRAGGHRLHVLRGPVLLATARRRRTKADWAEEVASLLEGRYADCEKITLVCDNLNTHTPGAFYEASCAGAGVGQASLLHAEAWELAEHRGERTQDPAVPAPPSARRHPPGGSVVRRRQRAAARRGLGKLTMPVAN